jgi:DNA-3-methyladenine glycosylase II
VLVIGEKPIEVAVTQTGRPDTPRLQVSLTGNQASAVEHGPVRKALERLLGLRLELGAFYRISARDSKLGPLVERFRGVKPPRFPTLFEALANAIACQQMSLSLGILLLSRLTQRFGLEARGTAGSFHAFPRPTELAGLKPDDFRELGFSRQKGRALVALAQAFCERLQEWESLESSDNQAVVERLLELRGIGRWSAEYVLLRGLRRLDVYPGDDVGARNNLRRWLGLRRTLDYEGVRRITARWQPYAGLVYFHMLLDRLAAAGYLRSQAGSIQPGGVA